MQISKKISCDIDGILNNYPYCWLEYLSEQCGVLYTSIEDAKKAEPFYKMIKDRYRCSSYKANLPVNIIAVKLLQQIKKQNYSLIMATSRPIDNLLYPKLKEMTEQWLKKNEVLYDEIVFKDEKVDYIDLYENIEFHIEDDMEYAKIVAKKGVKTFLYTALSTSTLSNDINIEKENIIIINNLLDILNHI
jgi:hypothetical protein